MSMIPKLQYSSSFHAGVFFNLVFCFLINQIKQVLAVQSLVRISRSGALHGVGMPWWMMWLRH